MRILLILFSILSSFNVGSAIDGMQETDWNENTERAGQWFVEDEKDQTSSKKQETDLDNTLDSTESEMTGAAGEKETEQDIK